MTNETNLFEKQINEYVGKGVLVVKVNNSSVADMIFKDMFMKISEIDSLGIKKQIMENQMPEFNIQGLNEDGKIDGKLNSQTEILAKILFPVINKNLKLNETHDLPLDMAFNQYGYQIKVKGQNSIKYDGNGELKTKINISEFENLQDSKKYISYLKGNSSYNFDNQKGYFKSGTININMAIGSIENKISVITMNSNSTITLKLISVN